MPSIAFACLAFAVLLQASETAAVEDPALIAAVVRFYDVQEQEDVEGYLALWSSRAQRPTAEQLKFVFESGDDRFSDLRITRAVITGDRARLRVEVRRERTRPAPMAGLPPIVASSMMRVALAFEREGTEWKLIREGPAADDLAAELLEAATEEDRERLLAGEAELMGPQLLAALARLGSAAAMRGAYPQSLAIFEQLVVLARRTGHLKEEGEGLQNVGNALYFMRRLPEALAAYEGRLAIERERGDEGGTAAALSGIATIRYSLAEYTEALARYREALAIQERLDDVAGIEYTTLSIGHITYLQGDFTAAIAAYERSLALGRSMHHADGESRALEGLGRVYTAQGDYASAVAVLEVVRTDPRMRNSPDRLGAVSQSLGDVHVRLGNLEAARAAYGESRRHFDSRGDLANVGRVLQDLAFVELLAGRFAEAEAHYKDSIATCAEADDRPCSTRAVAGFAYAQYAQENFWGAVVSYRSAITAFEALGRAEDAARAEVGLSQAQSGAGDQGAAIEAAIRARRAAEGLENDDILWRALAAESRAIRRHGDRVRALGHARTAASVIERMQRAAVDRPGSSVPADAAGALALLGMLQAESGDAAGAFATTEQIRFLERRARLARSERDISRGMGTEERDEERTHAAQVLTALARLTRERELPRPDPARLAQLQESWTEATAARRESMHRLFERLPDLRAWRGLAPPPAAGDVEPLLAGEGTVLLSIVLDDDGVLAIAVSRAESGLTIEAAVTPASRREAARLIAALQEPARLTDAAGWREAAREVVSLLPAPIVARAAAARRIMIVPHDVFWRVPFGALPIGGDILLERASVVVAGSLESLLRSAAATREPSGGFVAIGAPAISPARTGRLRQVAPDWFLRAPEEIEAELAAGGDVFEAESRTLFTRGAATEAALRRRAAGAAVLHVAAPFRLHPGSPLFSPILLAETEPAVAAGEPRPAGAGTPAGSAAGETPAPFDGAAPGSHPGLPGAGTRDANDDGVLEVRELFDVDWPARVAVLSDGGAMSMREGAAAADVLAWGWLAAGVPSVVIARWPAASGDSGRMLALFYRALRNGAAPAEALRTAQLAVRAQAETSAPHHWAGWLLLGGMEREGR